MLSLVVARGGGRGRRWWAIMPRSASGLPSTTTPGLTLSRPWERVLGTVLVLDREVLDREWEAEPDEEPVVG